MKLHDVKMQDMKMQDVKIQYKRLYVQTYAIRNVLCISKLLFIGRTCHRHRKQLSKDKS